MKLEIKSVELHEDTHKRYSINLEILLPQQFDGADSDSVFEIARRIFFINKKVEVSEPWDIERMPPKISIISDKISKELINHPYHYGGERDPYETVKVIEAWYGLEGLKYFCLGSNLKYLTRAGKKEGNSEQQDLEKAQWYIEYYNKRFEENEKLNF
jgi:hypothetical protein